MRRSALVPTTHLRDRVTRIAHSPTPRCLFHARRTARTTAKVPNTPASCSRVNAERVPRLRHAASQNVLNACDRTRLRGLPDTRRRARPGRKRRCSVSVRRPLGPVCAELGQSQVAFRQLRSPAVQPVEDVLDDIGHLVFPSHLVYVEVHVGDVQKLAQTTEAVTDPGSMVGVLAALLVAKSPPDGATKMPEIPRRFNRLLPAPPDPASTRSGFREGPRAVARDTMRSTPPCHRSHSLRRIEFARALDVPSGRSRSRSGTSNASSNPHWTRRPKYS